MKINKEIPVIDFDDKDFKEKLNFEIWSTGGSSDYSNDRNRPYNGQSHTDDGKRGQTEVKGLTMRDIRDCLVKAMLMSAATESYLATDEWLKCWDFSSGVAVPTQYLLDRQNKPEYISVKAELGTWRTQDIYKIDFSNVDPLAICQNLTCEIERMMGIFPNIDKSVGLWEEDSSNG